MLISITYAGLTENAENVHLTITHDVMDLNMEEPSAQFPYLYRDPQSRRCPLLVTSGG